MSGLSVVRIRHLASITLLGVSVWACDVADPEATSLLRRAAEAQDRLAWNGLRTLESDGSVLTERIAVRRGEVRSRKALLVDGVAEADLDPDGARAVAHWERSLELAPSRFRYSEFHLHGGLDRLLGSYRVEMSEARASIADLDCRRVDLTPYQAGTRLSYQVWIETSTGMVLGYDRFDWNGTRIDRMRYREIHFETSGAETQSAAETQVSDLDASLVYLPLEDALEQLSFRPLLPRYIPSGFRDYKTAILSLERPPVPLKHAPAMIANEYLLHSMTDGVNLLFVISLPVGNDQGESSADLGGSSDRRVEVSRFPLDDDSGLTAFSISSESVATFIIGQIAESELITMVESLEFAR